MDRLEETLGYVFHDQSLLVTALTHSSYANEHSKSGAESYERLEFLGDSILGFVCAEYLYLHVPCIPEGRMTRLRAELVCEESLHTIARKLNLSCFMRLGKGEEKTGGRERVSVMADMVEAIIAAIYLDSNLEEAKKFILRTVLSHVNLDSEDSHKDWKTELQELVQKQHDAEIVYELSGESGPDHNKSFVYQVAVNGTVMGSGKGKTKKEAEQNAARLALSCLRKDAL